MSKKEIQKSARVFGKDGLEIGVELVAKQIEEISAAMARLDKTRVSKKLLLALIHDDTKLGKTQIELVLDSLRLLEQRYLKKL